MNLITNGLMSRSGRIKIRVQGTVTGSSNLTVPVGTTSVRFTGQGGAGVYNAGSPMTAPTIWAGTITSGPVSNQYGNDLYLSGQTQYFTNAGVQLSQNLYWDASGGTWGRLGLYVPQTTIATMQYYYSGGGSYVQRQFVPYTSGYVYANLNAQTTYGVMFAIPGSVVDYGGGGGVAMATMNVTVSTSGIVTAAVAAYYTAGTSTTVSSGQSTNGSKTWASHASAGNPSAYDQYITFAGTGGTVSYSVATGTSLQYDYDYFLT